MKWNIFKRTPKAEKKKKSKTREWLDAIVFAVVAATIIRGLLFSAYAIPSESMEGTEYAGDYLFVSKISYGPRIANTPLAIPFVEPKVYGMQTYTSLIQLPYWRLPGFTEVKKGDVIVFNKPDDADLGMPVDERTTLIKRCQATPGDKLSIINGQVYINDKPAKNALRQQTNYIVVTNGVSINPQILEDCQIETVQQLGADSTEMFIPRECVAKLKTYSNVKSVEPIYKKPGVADPNVFPHSARFKWNEDNFGPLVLPKRGWKVALNDSTLTLYRRAIEVYEHNQVAVKGKNILVNGKKAVSYTFKMNYYWMMGDNRHNSLDCRFWGYVPEDHIIGKALITVLSTDSSKGIFSGKIRWSRMFRSID